MITNFREGVKNAIRAGVVAAESSAQQLRVVTIDAPLAFSMTLSYVDRSGKLRATTLTVDDTALADPDVIRRATAAGTRVAKAIFAATGSTYVISSPGSTPIAISTSEIQ